MCDPMAIIGGVISMASSAMAAQQQRAYQNEVNRQNQIAYDISKRAREAELGRQAGMEADAARAWTDTARSLTRDDADAGAEEASKAFVEDLDARPDAVSEGQLLSGQQFANNEIKTEIAKRANSAAAETRKRIEALAKLSAYGSVGMDRGVQIGQNADLLTTLSGLRRGSLGVSQQEQNIAPAQVFQGSSAAADILSGVGGMVSSRSGKAPANPAAISPAATASIYRGTNGLY